MPTPVSPQEPNNSPEVATSVADYDLITGIAEAHSAGLNMELYFRLLAVGATHPEVMLASFSLGNIKLFQYLIYRESGATNAESTHAVNLDIPALWYSRAREAGSSHAEIAEAKLAYLDTALYVRAIEAGVTHSEILYAHRISPDVTGYVIARDERNMDHETALHEVQYQHDVLMD